MVEGISFYLLNLNKMKRETLLEAYQDAATTATATLTRLEELRQHMIATYSSLKEELDAIHITNVRERVDVFIEYSNEVDTVVVKGAIIYLPRPATIPQYEPWKIGFYDIHSHAVYLNGNPVVFPLYRKSIAFMQATIDNLPNVEYLIECAVTNAMCKNVGL